MKYTVLGNGMLKLGKWLKPFDIRVNKQSNVWGQQKEGLKPGSVILVILRQNTPKKQTVTSNFLKKKYFRSKNIQNVESEILDDELI